MFHDVSRGMKGSAHGWQPKEKPLLKGILVLVFIFAPAYVSSWEAAGNQALDRIVSAAGSVTVWDQAGQQVLPVKNGGPLARGERVVTSGDGSVVLGFFDGSRLTLHADTEVSLIQLKKNPARAGVLRFKMTQGKISAEVARPASGETYFEVEAGGVVCGARGTKFTMQYDPGSRKLDLQVSGGSVYANSGGTKLVLKAGQQIGFRGGQVSTGKGPAASANADEGPEEPARTGFHDPALKDLHDQFGWANNTYRNQAFNDPDAGGLKTKLNPNAANGPGIIEANP